MEANYSNMTEEQKAIIYDYCKDDMKKLRKVCFVAWGNKGFPSCYHEDLYDDAVIVLSESLMTFNPELNKNFNTYLINNVRLSSDEWYRNNFLRLKKNNLQLDEHGKIKRDEKGKPIIIHGISLDAPVEDGINLCDKVASSFMIENEIIERKDFSLDSVENEFSPEMKEYLFNMLSKLQRKILELMICGYIESEIIEILHIDSALYKDSIAAIKSNRNTRKIKHLLRGGQSNVK